MKANRYLSPTSAVVMVIPDKLRGPSPARWRENGNSIYFKSLISLFYEKSQKYLYD